MCDFDEEDVEQFEDENVVIMTVFICSDVELSGIRFDKSYCLLEEQTYGTGSSQSWVLEVYRGLPWSSLIPRLKWSPVRSSRSDNLC